MNFRLINLLLLTSLPCAIALAQNKAATEAEIIPRYDVEIVIFKNLKVPTSREFVLPVSSPGKPKKTLDLSSSSSVKAARKIGYEVLPEDSFRLRDVVARLTESTRYQLLLHTAWRQPGLESDQIMPVWIKAGRIFGNEYTSIDSRIELSDVRAKNTTNQQSGEHNFEFEEQTPEAQELQLLQQHKTLEHKGLNELEGKISIVLSRYLHVYTDLVLRRPRLLADETPGNAAQQAYVAANLADTRILNNHHLKEHRRMRSKNLHYIDSPEFGMLILITPYELAQGFEEAPIEAEVDGEAVTAE